MITVLFACVHNAGRSQMAAGVFNALADPTKARAISAGTQPAERVHPEVLVAMDEIGIHLGAAKPQLLTEGLARQAQLLVTMGCGEACPIVPGLERVDWELLDPKGQTLERVRAIRDELLARVTALLEQLQVSALGRRSRGSASSRRTRGPDNRGRRRAGHRS